MSPVYGTTVDYPGGYSFQLTDRGETLIYRGSECHAHAIIGWEEEEGGGYRPRLYAHSVGRPESDEPLPRKRRSW